MPIYDYVCGVCDRRLEVIHGVHDEGPRFCSACGAEGTMRKAFVPPTIVFKGSGWAKKDRASRPSAGTKAAGEAKDSGSTADATPAATTGGGDAASESAAE
jgi:putative FmdB family regulatory protein